MNTFERFHSRTILRAELELQTALSVGSRTSLEPTGSDLPVIRSADGAPFIPGSSLKGVVRAETERILRAAKLPGLRACDPFAQPCVDRNKKEALLRQAMQKGEREQEVEFTRLIWQNSCAVCRLFGSPWLASRLLFKDASLINGDDLPIVTQVRDGVGIDRDTGAAADGLKYDYEVVVPGTRFAVEILAENLEEWEMGLLLAMLRPLQEGLLPLGGKSSRGPGWGKLRGLTLQRVDTANLLDYLIKGEMAIVQPETFADAFQRTMEERRASDA